MLTSKNDFFFSNSEVLYLNRNKLEYVLSDIWKSPSNITNIYLKAYDFFTSNPDKYDGATIVKDLNIIPGLDVWAMLHDYLYVTLNVAVNLKYKYYADIIYALEMERMGSSAYSTWSRMVGLTLLGGLFFTPYEYLKGKRITNKMKQEMNNIYSKFSKLHKK